MGNRTVDAKNAAMMEIVESMLSSEPESKQREGREEQGQQQRQQQQQQPLLWTSYKYYNPVGKRIYIDPEGDLVEEPFTKALVAKRIHDLEGKTLDDYRRAHSPFCFEKNDNNDSDGDGEDNRDNEENTGCAIRDGEGTVCGGYFRALAPEICARVAASEAAAAATKTER